jgi:predicted permease
MNKLNSRQGPQPPLWAQWLLEWLAADHLLEEVQGDLQELFDKRLQTHSPRKARLYYMLDLLKLIHPRLWKTNGSPHSSINPMDILQHSLLLSLRNFQRFKGAFFINLIGLSTGIACALLIFLWVKDELNVDKFYEKDGQLYSVMHNFTFPNGDQTWHNTPTPLAQALAEEMPEVEYAVAVNTFKDWFKGPGVVSQGDRQVKAKGIFATKDYFNVFSCKLLAGHKEKVLSDKQQVVISESLAKKLFTTSQEVVGKTLEWNHKLFDGPFQIAGVFETPPPNSTSQFDIIFNYGILLEADIYSGQWNGGYAETYLILKEGTDIDAFNQKIAGFLQVKDPFNDKSTLFVQQYSKKYLYDRYENGVQTGGRIEYVRLFSIVAIFILLIACINFMNLATAKATRRIKEIGIKKAVGADRKVLIFQFLSESLLMCGISVVAALFLVAFLLPEFNALTAKSLHLQADGSLILPLLCITLFTGLMAGSYPALYLSGFHPAVVLKGKINNSVGELWARKGLVVFQFTLSMIFIVGFLVMNKQIEYTQTKNLWYDKDNIVSFSRQGPVNSKDYITFVTELKRIPSVVNATSMAGNILKDITKNTGFTWEGQAEGEKDMSFPSLRVSYDFIETLGIELKEGRTFTTQYADEGSKVLLNEAAVKLMDFDRPVGKTIKFGTQEYQIIGIVKNFHYGSLHQKVDPLIFRYEPHQSNMLVKIEAGSEKVSLAQIKEVYEKFHPKYPFEFTFMDEDYQALYESESRVATLSNYFAVLAIVISCLGLFGLAAYTAERRRKEIGIRKVLGSSELAIVRLLSGEFMQMVFVAILIALPISYLVARNWLQNFAYAIDLEWWFFAGAGLMSLIITGLTVAIQTLKAAKINPVRMLRDE